MLLVMDLDLKRKATGFHVSFEIREVKIVPVQLWIG